MKISSCKGVSPLPSRYSAELQDLVNEILVSDPKKRPSINQILKKDLLKERVKKYLKDEEFEEEFSHTILHNQYLFDKRRNRAKPASQAYDQAPPVPKPSDKESPFIIKSVAPAPKEPGWVKQSPRGPGAGFSGHKVLSSRKKDSASKQGYRPYSAKYHHHGRPLQKKRSTPNGKGLVIQGEEIRPAVNRGDGKKKAIDVIEEENKKLGKERERLEKQYQQRKLEIQNKQNMDNVHEKIKNIYDLKKEQKKEENKAYPEPKENKPANFEEKPLQQQLGWMKPSDDESSSKENNPFEDNSDCKQVKKNPRGKIEKYRQSIIKMLDGEDEECDQLDGLETNRELSEGEVREDDNIMDVSNRSIRSKVPKEDEEEVHIEDDEEEPELIEGESYFQLTEPLQIEPLGKLLKSIIIDKYGVENTEKGIDYIKKLGTQVFIENDRRGLLHNFKNQCFHDTDDSVLEFISTVCSFLSYN